jgi:hypothetical protein
VFLAAQLTAALAQAEPDKVAQDRRLVSIVLQLLDRVAAQSNTSPGLTATILTTVNAVAKCSAFADQLVQQHVHTPFANGSFGTGVTDQRAYNGPGDHGNGSYANSSYGYGNAEYNGGFNDGYNGGHNRGFDGGFNGDRGWPIPPKFDVVSALLKIAIDKSVGGGQCANCPPSPPAGWAKGDKAIYRDGSEVTVVTVDADHTPPSVAPGEYFIKCRSSSTRASKQV